MKTKLLFFQGWSAGELQEYVDGGIKALGDSWEIVDTKIACATNQTVTHSSSSLIVVCVQLRLKE